MTRKKLAYTKVVEYLTEAIRNGTFPEGELVPSEMALARELGVSTGTAKFAVEKMSAAGVLRRVPRVGTFVAAASADVEEPVPPAAGSSKGSVYMVVPCLPDSYLMTIVQGVEREARARGIDVILRVTDHDEGIEREVLEEIRQGSRGYGVIVFPVAGSVCPDGLLRMKLDGYPVVVLDREYSGVQIDTVIPDHYNGAILATEHLLALGHGRIGFISTDIAACSASRARYNGFLNAMAKSDSRVDKGMILNSGELVMHEPGITPELVATLEAFIRRNPEMTAINAVNDYLAVASIKAATNLGLDVPGGLCVTGFSNNDIGRNTGIPVTTVDHRAEGMGGTAMELLLKRINSPGGPPERVVLPATLIVRESTFVG